MIFQRDKKTTFLVIPSILALAFNYKEFSVNCTFMDKTH